MGWKETLSEIAKKIPEVEEMLKDAEELIRALAEAGEDTSELRRKYTEAKARLQNWKSMLKRRGLLK